MQLILLARYWQYIVIAVLTALSLFATSSCSTNAKRIDAIKTEHQLTLTTKEAAYELRAIQIEQQNLEGVIDAVNQSTLHQKHLADKYDSVVVINGSLSDTISNIETSLISANRAAVIDYTKSVNGLFTECSNRYLEMAKNAAREQEDA